MRAAYDRGHALAVANDYQLHAKIAEPGQRSAFDTQHALTGKAANRTVVVVQPPGRSTLVDGQHRIVVIGGRFARRSMIVVGAGVFADRPVMRRMAMVVEQSPRHVGRQIGGQQHKGRQAVVAEAKHTSPAGVQAIKSDLHATIPRRAR